MEEISPFLALSTVTPPNEPDAAERRDNASYLNEFVPEIFSVIEETAPSLPNVYA
jgi:hypothetical protein